MVGEIRSKIQRCINKIRDFEAEEKSLEISLTILLVVANLQLAFITAKQNEILSVQKDVALIDMALQDPNIQCRWGTQDDTVILKVGNAGQAGTFLEALKAVNDTTSEKRGFDFSEIIESEGTTQLEINQQALGVKNISKLYARFDMGFTGVRDFKTDIKPPKEEFKRCSRTK
jgi:hypothetical protein